jgi:uncharacterized spore protein YtfJ
VDSVSKILDMVPDVINKFTQNSKKKDDVEDKVEEALKKQAESSAHE